MKNLVIHINEKGIATNGTAIRKYFSTHKAGSYLLASRSLNKRTIPQNSYLHLIFSMLVEPLREAGWNNIRGMEDAKEFVKALFLTVTEKNEKTGEEIKRVKHTSELTKEEVQIFIDDLKQWSSEYLGFYIPDSNEQVSIFQY